MAFLDVVGELFGYAGKGWSLKVEDPGLNLEFKGEFPAQNMTESFGANLGETVTVGKEKPNFQWLSGDASAFTFTGRIFARDSFKNVRQEINLLRDLGKRNQDLKRAPRCTFSAGIDISFICFVRGVRLVYDEIRSDGAARGAICEITLQIIEDVPKEDATVSMASYIKAGIGVAAAAVGIAQTVGSMVDIPGGSLHTINRKYVAKHGDTFESIAKAEYGSARLGDILRRVQPAKEPLVAGVEVMLVDPTEITTIKVTQQAVALKNTPKNLALRNTKLAARNRKTTIVV